MKSVTRIFFLLAILLFFIYLLVDYLVRQTLFVENFESKSSEIPLNIFQTWKTDNLPPNMKKIIDDIKKDNPEFKYKCFNDNECTEFIKENFDEKVLDAYNRIIPGTYRADFWRYCILYINGGIYLDAKMKPINGFKFIAVTDKEYFCRDFDGSGRGVVNCFMVTKPKNEILLKAINAIVENVNNKYYGESPLAPTGPLLLKRFFTEKEIDNLEFEYCTDTTVSPNFIMSRVHNSYKDAIFERDTAAYDEQNKNRKRYEDHWNERTMYSK